MADAKEMAKIAVEALEEKNAEDIRIIDITKVSVIADYFIITNGTNSNQVKAMADEVEEKLGRAGYAPKHIEGYLNGNWVLMDYGDIVLHLFDSQNRVFYDLERIWRDGELVSKDKLD